LYAIANSPSSTSLENNAERAQAILERMLLRYKREGKDCPAKPDLNSFFQVISTWTRGKSPNFEVGMQNVYKLLLEWSEELEIQPDTDTFNALMSGWLKSRDPKALSKIQQTMQEMEESYKSGNLSARPDRVSLNTMHVAFNKHRRNNQYKCNDIIERLSTLETEYRIPRTFLSQNILMESIIKSGERDAPEKVMELLTKMEDDYKNGVLDMKPDQCSYSSVIRAYLRYGREDAAAKSEELLARMWDLHRNHGGNAPDVEIYNSVVNAYASQESSHALERVKEILREMENGEKEGIPRPNLITFNLVIKSMRNGNKEEGAVFAEDILTTLESMGGKDPNLLPDNYSYTSVITAYARSDSSRKAEKAFEIVERMMEARANGNKGALVTAHTFNAALNACAFVEGGQEEKAKAFGLAMKLNTMRKECGEEADNTWYGTMLRVCSSLLQPSKQREHYVENFFTEACEFGCVGRLVITQLKFAATPEQYSNLLDRDTDDRMNLRDLPKEWTCNARENRPSFISYGNNNK
jgi:hypothetical protein